MKRRRTYGTNAGKAVEDRDHESLFGLRHFHEHIPLLRLLWKYRICSDTTVVDDMWEDEGPPTDDGESDVRWADDIEVDYPLRRAVRRVGPLRTAPSSIRPRTSSSCCAGRCAEHGGAGDAGATRPARIRAAPIHPAAAAPAAPRRPTSPPLRKDETAGSGSS